jgi:hypothetical protein
MWSFIHNKTAQAISAWLTIFATAFAVLSKLTPEWFGTLTLSQAILLGTGLAISLALAIAITLAIGGFGYRLIRPLPSTFPSGWDADLPVLDHPGEDDFRDELRALADRIGDLKQGSSVAEAMHLSDQRLAAVTERFGERLEKLETHVDAIIRLDKKSDEVAAKEYSAATDAIGGLRAYADELGRRIGQLLEGQVEVRREQQDFQQKMEAWVGALQRKIRLGFAGVDQGFAAILDRERLLSIAADIQDIGDDLAGPSNGKPLGDWGAWQAKFADWQRAVEAWARRGDAQGRCPRSRSGNAQGRI